PRTLCSVATAPVATAVAHCLQNRCHSAYHGRHRSLRAPIRQLVRPLARPPWLARRGCWSPLLRNAPCLSASEPHARCTLPVWDRLASWRRLCPRPSPATRRLWSAAWVERSCPWPVWVASNAQGLRSRTEATDGELPELSGESSTTGLIISV